MKGKMILLSVLMVTFAIAFASAKRVNVIELDSLANTTVCVVPSSDSTVCERGIVEVADNVNVAPAPHWGHKLRALFKGILPLIAVVLAFLVPAVVIIWVVTIICRAATQQKRDRARLLSEAVNRGYVFPDSFYRADEPNPHKLIKSGIVWIGWGLACMVLAYTCSSFFAALGVALMFVGIARIAVYVVSRHEQQSDRDQ